MSCDAQLVGKQSMTGNVAENIPGGQCEGELSGGMSGGNIQGQIDW